MQKYSLASALAVSALAAAAVAAAGMQTFTRAATPSPATTFPSLTTIYVGAGVLDDGSANNSGIATAFTCTNVSGNAAQVRYLVLNQNGSVEASLTTNHVHGTTNTLATHTAEWLVEGSLATGSVTGGVVNIESTESAVFCTAMIINAAGAAASGIPLRLVRVNAHPGTVE
jgi:hypothetical protein